MAGSAPAWSMSERVSGTARVESEEEGTRTRGRELRVEADEFQGLGVGEALVIDATARRRAQVVRIWGPQGAVAARSSVRSWAGIGSRPGDRRGVLTRFVHMGRLCRAFRLRFGAGG